MAIENDKINTLRETDQKSIVDLNERLKALEKANYAELQDFQEEAAHKQLEMV